MPHPRQATWSHEQLPPVRELGSIWQVGEYRYIVGEDGRWCTYPSMTLLWLELDTTDAQQLHVAPPP